MMLQHSTRVSQKPTQDHENDSNKGQVANISSVRDDDCPSHGSVASPSQDFRRDNKACGKTTGWEGYCTTRKSKEKAGKRQRRGELLLTKGNTELGAPRSSATAEQDPLSNRYL